MYVSTNSSREPMQIPPALGEQRGVLEVDLRAAQGVAAGTAARSEDAVVIVGDRDLGAQRSPRW